MDAKKLMEAIKAVYHKRLLKECRDPAKAEDKLVDRTKIIEIIIIRYIIKTVRLILMIAFISYFLAIFIIIKMQIVHWLYGDWNKEVEDPILLSETFYGEYKIYDRSTYEQTIAMIYFAFTTLSTVGFGDYHPKNDIERLGCSVVLVLGVATMSVVLSNFLEMVDKFNELWEEPEEMEELAKFFGLLKRMNGNQDYSDEIRFKIEAYFDYKWKNDKNMAIQTDSELNLFNQLRIEEQVRIYTNVFFDEFLQSFRKLFSIINYETQNSYAFYQYTDSRYFKFMYSIMSKLRPIRYD